MTISSDEEEEGKTKKTENTNQSSTTLNNASNVFDEDMDTILDKEPIITNTTVYSACGNILTNNEDSDEGNIL